MEIDLDTLYAVLAPVARREGGSRGQIFYGELRKPTLSVTGNGMNRMEAGIGPWDG